MTSLAHTLVGMAAGVASLPDSLSPRHKAAHLALFALLANIPDLPLPGWGHDQYLISHSLYVNLLLISLAGIMLAWRAGWRLRLGGWKGGAFAALAWLSHFLLDSFYNHGVGAPIFWPFSSARLALPVPWLAILFDGSPPSLAHMLSVFLIEMLTYSPLLLLAILIKWLLRRKALAGKISQNTP